jgi:hypothetical protein
MRLGRNLLAFASNVVAPKNPLTALANSYGSDKGNRHFQAHNYTRIYEPLFAPFRNQPIRFLEIGLLNAVDRWSWANRGARLEGKAAGSRAPSLEMWSAYFPHATIFGFDINEFGSVRIARCKILRGDMGSEADLFGLVSATGGAFDVILEDASHASHHQQIALGFLFEHVVPGGLYIIEDLNEQPGAIERAAAPKTRELLRRAQCTGEFASPFISAERQAFLSANVEAVDMYDSESQRDSLNAFDALAILRRSREPPGTPILELAAATARRPPVIPQQ